MPERNGAETARWIRHYEEEHGLRRLPIIGITGYESEDVKKLCIDSGMDNVMTKPVKRAELMSVLDQLIASR